MRVPTARVTGLFRSILGDETGVVGTSYEYSGTEKDEKIFLNFELGNIKSGDYELIIETEDLNAGSKTSKKVNLTIK